MKLEVLCGGHYNKKHQVSADARGSARSPLSADEDLVSEWDCVAHSPSLVTPCTVDTKSKPYTRRPKPPLSYIALIAMAIRDSGSGRLTLAEINNYLMQKFPFFRGSYTGWRNSVRHNLSLNDCFIKVLRDPSRPWGKDNYWMLNPNSEYTFADGVFRRRRKRIDKKLKTESSRAEQQAAPPSSPAPETDACGKFTSSFTIDSILSKPFTRDPLGRHLSARSAFTWRCQARFPFFRGSYQGWKNSVRHNLSLNECFIKLPKGLGRPGKGHYWTIDPSSEFMFEEGSFRRRPRGFRRKCQALKPLYGMMSGIGFGTSMLPQNFDFQAPSCHNSYNIDLMGNTMAGGFDGHHVTHMPTGSGPPYATAGQIAPNADYCPDSSSNSPLQSSPAMAGTLDCQSPYANAASHWSSPGMSSYIKQQSLSANSPASAAAHSGVSSYCLDQGYLHHSARDSGSDISVGLSRYSSHAVPACDRKEFLLNFNGIASLHASSGGSYYHQLHHRHQGVYQDVKPCVM